MFRDADYVALADHGHTPITPTEIATELSDVFHRINFASDLHLDFEGMPDSFFIENPAPTLILAGDIGEVKNYKLDRFQSFFRRCSEHWNDVIIIAGNHEHYGFRFDDTVDAMRDAVKEFVNFTVLDKNSIEINGVVFIGATLWTNFNNEDVTAMAAAGYAMNDYYHIKGTTKPITPHRTYAEHKEALHKIEAELAKNPSKACVVITHHGPTMKSIDPAYVKEGLINYAYASELDDFILSHPNIIHWIHGHMHTRTRYAVGDTQVHIHARGYPNQFLDYRSYQPNEIFV